MEITTVKEIFRLTDLQEETFQLIEDWLWSVIERGAPAPEEMRALIGQILEGEMPSEEMVATAAQALEAANLASVEEEDGWDGMSESEIPDPLSWVPEPWMMEEARAERIDRQLVGMSNDEIDRFFGYDPENDLGEVEES